MVSVDVKEHLKKKKKTSSKVRPSLVSLMVSVDVKEHLKKKKKKKKEEEKDE